MFENGHVPKTACTLNAKLKRMGTGVQADIEFVHRNSSIFRSFLLPCMYVVPFIFKPVFTCMHSENADKNWLQNARNHIQGRRNDLNMLLLRSTNSMSECRALPVNETFIGPSF